MDAVVGFFTGFLCFGAHDGYTHVVITTCACLHAHTHAHLHTHTHTHTHTRARARTRLHTAPLFLGLGRWVDKLIVRQTYRWINREVLGQVYRWTGGLIDRMGNGWGNRWADFRIEV